MLQTAGYASLRCCRPLHRRSDCQLELFFINKAFPVRLPVRHDEAQLRFAKGRRLGDNVYVRQASMAVRLSV